MYKDDLLIISILAYFLGQTCTRIFNLTSHLINGQYLKLKAHTMSDVIRTDRTTWKMRVKVSDIIRYHSASRVYIIIYSL